MTMAEHYMKELEAMTDRQSRAAWITNTELSQSTRDHYLDLQTRELNELDAKYQIKRVVLETRGILKNERYDFPDGSSYIAKMFE
jgi:hypothetical protein